jgi:hypothetical protein
MLKQIILEMVLDLLEESKTKKDYYIDKNGIAVMQVPMSFASMRPKKKALKESKALITSSVGPFQEHVSKALHQSKELHGKTSDEISDHLHKHYGAHVSSEDSNHIKHYTDLEKSGELSKKLIDNHKTGEHPTKGMSDEEKKTHHAIQKNVKPSKHEFYVHHGSSSHLANFHQSYNNPHREEQLVHLPSHLSTTHDNDTAQYFAHRTNKKDNGPSYLTNRHHIMRIKVKKGDKVLHVSKHSHHPIEHETILPAGTTLKYIKTTNHHHEGSDIEGAKPGQKYAVSVHHYEIHHQK